MLMTLSIMFSTSSADTDDRLYSSLGSFGWENSLAMSIISFIPALVFSCKGLPVIHFR
jgi:hypothetical protein